MQDAFGVSKAVSTNWGKIARTAITRKPKTPSPKLKRAMAKEWPSLYGGKK